MTKRMIVEVCPATGGPITGEGCAAISLSIDDAYDACDGCTARAVKLRAPTKDERHGRFARPGRRGAGKP